MLDTFKHVQLVGGPLDGEMQKIPCFGDLLPEELKIPKKNGGGYARYVVSEDGKTAVFLERDQ